MLRDATPDEARRDRFDQRPLERRAAFPFAQDLPEAERWLIAAGQRPLTLGANTTPPVTAAWKSLPGWAVVGTEDRVIPQAVQRSMAGRAGAKIGELVASHVSMVSQPQAAIDALLAAPAHGGD